MVCGKFPFVGIMLNGKSTFASIRDGDIFPFRGGGVDPPPAKRPIKGMGRFPEKVNDSLLIIKTIAMKKN